MFRMFPLILITVLVYNFMVFGGDVVHHFGSHAPLDLQPTLMSGVTIQLISGDSWKFTFGDLLLLATFILLFVEIIKATRTTSREIINHGLSMVTFVLALLEFITLKGFATSTFFFMIVMALFDVVAGYTISIVAAEHDLGMGRAGTD
jgi:hypothetical protein